MWLHTSALSSVSPDWVTNWSEQPQNVRFSVSELAKDTGGPENLHEIMNSAVSGCLLESRHRISTRLYFEVSSLVCVLFLSAAESVLMTGLFLVLKVAYTEAHRGEGGGGEGGGGGEQQQTDTRCFHTVQPTSQHSRSKIIVCSTVGWSVCLCNYYLGRGMPKSWVACF